MVNDDTITTSIPVDVLQDPITFEFLVDPIVMSDGHTYNRSTIRLLFQHAFQENKDPRSPFTRQPFVPVIIDNYLARQILDTFVPLLIPNVSSSSKKKKFKSVVHGLTFLQRLQRRNNEPKKQKKKSM